MRMMAMMLCTMTLICYVAVGGTPARMLLWASAPHVHCFISVKSRLACDVLAKTVSTVVIPSLVSVGFVLSKLERVFA